MPLIDVVIPEGALDRECEQALMSDLTDIVLTWEGIDPADPVAQAASWVFLHRPEALFVGGERCEHPRYRVVARLPEGQLDQQRRAGLIAAVTDAVLDAEPPGRPRDAQRVWVFTQHVEEGTWGAGGKVMGLADITALVLGPSVGDAQTYASRRLAIAKAEREAVFGDRSDRS